LMTADLLEFVGTPKRGGYTLDQTGAKHTFEKALPLLQSPVKKSYYVQLNDDKECIAGISALSEFSMLAAPKNKCIAVTTKQFKALKQDKTVTVLPYAEPGAVLIEVWTYNPRLLGDDECVDKLSLYVSLKDDVDERVQIALDEMTSRISWQALQ